MCKLHRCSHSSALATVNLSLSIPRHPALPLLVFFQYHNINYGTLGQSNHALQQTHCGPGGVAVVSPSLSAIVGLQHPPSLVRHGRHQGLHQCHVRLHPLQAPQALHVYVTWWCRTFFNVSQMTVNGPLTEVVSGWNKSQQITSKTLTHCSSYMLFMVEQDWKIWSWMICKGTKTERQNSWQ